MPAGVSNVSGVLDVLRGIVPAKMPDQIGKADDRVQRRAKLVAHVGEKFGFRPAGEFGLHLGGAHRVLALRPEPHLAECLAIIRQQSRRLAGGAR